MSFSNAPRGTEQLPALSAPVGLRSILAEVRASQPTRPAKTTIARNSQEVVSTRSSSQAVAKNGPPSNAASQDERGSTMSRGYVGGRSAHITTFAWLSSVKVGNKRDGSDGPPSGGESVPVSRYASRSRPPSVIDPSMSVFDVRGRSGKSGSRDRNDDEHREGDTNQTLKEE